MFVHEIHKKEPAEVVIYIVFRGNPGKQSYVINLSCHGHCLKSQGRTTFFFLYRIISVMILLLVSTWILCLPGVTWMIDCSIKWPKYIKSFWHLDYDYTISHWCCALTRWELLIGQKEYFTIEDVRKIMTCGSLTCNIFLKAYNKITLDNIKLEIMLEGWYYWFKWKKQIKNH